MKTPLAFGSTVDPQPAPPNSAGRRQRPRDLWLMIARRRGRSPGASVLTGLAALTVCLAALPLAMTVLSRLPAERRFQQCMEQPDVSQCRDPLTSWLH